ncbi:MAG TPA: family 78 glycoside hydrolase catalytic domain [Desulfuromonadaceae bacterium]
MKLKKKSQMGNNRRTFIKNMVVASMGLKIGFETRSEATDRKIPVSIPMREGGLTGRTGVATEVSGMHGVMQTARWIWNGTAADSDTWWMFRRSLLLPADCREACLRLTAAFHYLLYINGTLVTRGPARSYDFRKAYDTVDVQPYLRLGAENVLAILSPTQKHFAYGLSDKRPPGVLAELVWRNQSGELFAIATDRQWKTRRHEAFTTGTAGRSLGFELLLGREERFDARLETMGWSVPGFNDSSWDAAYELGPANMAPWTKLEASGIGLLSDDPVFPNAFTAIELSRRRPGYRMRLETPVQFLDSTKVYATEVRCAAPTTIRIHTGAVVHLNGQPSDARAEMILPGGVNLLCLCQRGYFTGELDVLMETQGDLSFSASGILGTSDAPWVLCAFPATAVNYPWHETSATITDPPELLRLLTSRNAAAIRAELRTGFTPIAQESGSVSQDVRTQYYYSVRGGHTDPAIEKGQPRTPAEPGLTSPLRNPQNLLHGHPDATTILPTSGYDTHFVVDFGRETIGYVEFTVKAPAGAIIDAQCFEMLTPGGIAWMQHNGFRYICRGGLQTFISHFRRGFRFISLTIRGFEQPLEFYTLRCRRTTYAGQEIGSFECSDWQLNQSYRMSLDTAALCMLDTYVDCPGYEQSFWVGDAHITSLINMLSFGAYDLDQRSIRLVGQSLSPEWVKEYWPDDERYTSGRYLPIAAFPNYPEGGLPMWPLLWIIQCWEHYLHGGDLEDLKENYGYVAEMLRHCQLLTNTRGLFDMPGAWNLIEWGNNDLSPYGEVTANNVLLVQCFRLAARMAKALSLDISAKVYTNEADKRQSAINRYCWEPQRQAYVDTVRDDWAYQRYLELCSDKGWTKLPSEKYLGCLRVSEQTNTLALLCGCVPPERLKSVEAIVRRVEQGRFIPGSPAGRSMGKPSYQEAPDGIVAIGSPFFLFFSLGALFQMGEADRALEVIRREWGKMAASGLRTCPESFGNTRSAAHAWSASPAIYLPAHVLGIRPLEPGFGSFIVDPYPCNLDWAHGAVATPHGPIYVRWQRINTSEIEISCSAPEECRIHGIHQPIKLSPNTFLWRVSI